MAGRARPRKWIKGAIKRPGAFTAAAKRAGVGVAAYAQRMKGAAGRIGKQARLAITLKKIGSRRSPAQRRASARKGAATRRRRG